MCPALDQSPTEGVDTLGTESLVPTWIPGRLHASLCPTPHSFSVSVSPPHMSPGSEAKAGLWLASH